MDDDDHDHPHAAISEAERPGYFDMLETALEELLPAAATSTSRSTTQVGIGWTPAASSSSSRDSTLDRQGADRSCVDRGAGADGVDCRFVGPN